MGDSDSAGKNAPRRRPQRGSLWKAAAILLFCLWLPAAWRWTPLSESINFATIIAWQQSIQAIPAAPYLVIAGFVVGSLVFFPVTMMTLATVFTFGPKLGNLYALAGWVLSAAIGYGIGRFLGNDGLRKIAGRRFDRLFEQAGRHGLITVLTMRILPVAPFTLVNLFTGALRIRFADFVLASLIGRIPGMIALALIGFQLEKTLRTPGVEKFVLLGFWIMVLLVLGIWLSRRFAARAVGRQVVAERSGPL